MTYLVQLTKAVLLIFYAVALLSLIAPFLSEYRRILWIIAALLVAVHAGEYVALKDKMASADPEQSNHLIKTLLFGYGHWLPLVRKR